MPPKENPRDNPKENPLHDEKICFGCKKSVVGETISCSGCKTLYHPGCASRLTSLEGGAYTKCCRPRAQSPRNTDFLSIASSSQTNEAVINTDMLVSKVLAGLQPELAEIRHSMNNLTITMNDITSKVDDTRDRLTSTESKVLELEDKIDTMEGKMLNMNTSSTNTYDLDSISRNCMAEYENRMSRKNNLILFGLSEHVIIEIGHDSRNDDKEKISQLVSSFVRTPLLDGISTHRIGLYLQNQTRPRPVKLICHSQEDAKEFLYCFIKAKKRKSPLLTNLTLSMDKTKMQQIEFASLKRELMSRRQLGETNIIISYRHGAPVITKIQMKPATNTGTVQTTPTTSVPPSQTLKLPA